MRLCFTSFKVYTGYLCDDFYNSSLSIQFLNYPTCHLFVFCFEDCQGFFFFTSLFHWPMDTFKGEQLNRVMYLFLAKHPQQWTKEEVAVWLRWCGEEYSIDAVPADKFDMNGKKHFVFNSANFKMDIVIFPLFVVEWFLWKYFWYRMISLS